MIKVRIWANREGVRMYSFYLYHSPRAPYKGSRQGSGVQAVSGEVEPSRAPVSFIVVYITQYVVGPGNKPVDFQKKKKKDTSNARL